MDSIVIKIVSMLSIIALGYLIKRLGIVRQEDYRVMTAVMIHITLPATIFVNYDGFEIQPSLFLLPVLIWPSLSGTAASVSWSEKAVAETQAF